MQERVVSTVHSARRMLLGGDAIGAIAALDGVDASGFASYHVVRAECLYAQHQYAEAKAECEAAFAISPNSPRVAILLELIQEMLQLDRWVQPEKKIVAAGDDVQLEFSKMERLTPDAPSTSDVGESESSGLVSETLATILTQQGKYAEARKIYIRLSRMHPDRDAYYHERIEQLETQMAS